MNYYYDAIINFQDNYIHFYEWDSLDELLYIKKIMIFNVSHHIFSDIIENKIAVNKELLDIIHNKTKLKSNKYIPYACIFSDNKNALVVEFNNKGESICKSSLLLEDEINICEISYSAKTIDLKYNILEKDIIKNESVQAAKIKKYILLEVNKTYQEKNYSKLKFIFLSWFNYLEEDIDKIIEIICKELECDIGEREYKIYDLIKLSYNNV